MAPNRKSLSALVQTLSSADLQSLQQTVEPKFLPLTDPREKEQQQSQNSSKSQVADSASYWDWESEPQSQTVDIFSASNIESNLIQAAAAASESSEPVVSSDSDDYWAEQSQPSSSSKTHSPQHIECNYWNFPSDVDAKQAAIDNIVAEERAYHLLSAATTQENEVEAANNAGSSSHVHPTKVSNDGYWVWESACVSSDQSGHSDNYWDWDASRVNPLQAILEYETARQLLKSETIVQQLQSGAPRSCASALTACSDEYWSWSEQYDQYWDMQPAVIPAGASNGYWDW